MSQSLTKLFVSNNFNPERYVKEISSQCVGADELRQQRAKIQDLASNTSESLKKNVYQNYKQFIETAKEISHLESEMYQLCQLLSEQRSLLNTLSHEGTKGVISNDLSTEKKNALGSQIKEDSKLKLVQLLENIEGSTNLIEKPGRICLYEGSLLELDPLDSKPLRRIHAYLFNDILIITSSLDNCNRRSSPKFKVQVVYDLQSLAVVNIKDLGTVKFAFKLLAFPDSRVFQCSTATSKKEWLEICEQAKKLKISNETQSELTIKVEPSGMEHSIYKSESLLLKSSSIENHEKIPEWLIEVIEDLDSCIAQRHFEDAYDLLKKTEEYLNNCQDNLELYDIKSKLNDRTNNLVHILTKELELISESKSLQGGGYRSAKKAVKLLTLLNRSTQACQLYLMICSSTLKARLKKVKRDGATSCYIKRLSSTAISNISEMLSDFLSIFPYTTKCTSALVMWCSHELKILTVHLSKQMFLPQVSLNALGECLVTVRNHCEQLIDVGIDIRHQFDIYLRSTLAKTLLETKEKYIDAVKIRSLEDNWRPSHFETTQNFYKIYSELENLGIPMIESLDANRYSIPLTSNTLTFSKLYIGLVEDCLNIYVPEIITTIQDVLVGILQIQIQYLLSSLTNFKHKQEITLIQNNMLYYNVLIDRTLELYGSVVGHQFTQLQVLKEKLCFEFKQLSIKPQPAPRNSVTKYSTMEYI